MARRGKSQARRSGQGGSLPGWLWLLIGAVLTLVAVLVVPKYMVPDRGSERFFRPRPNPEARPAISALEEAAPPRPRPANERPLPAPLAEPDYDFYTLLPGESVPAEPAARAHAGHEPATTTARAETPSPQAREHTATTSRTRPPPPAPPPAASHPDAATPSTPPASKEMARAEVPSRYLLQAGTFNSAAEAESLKAQIALLGLQARIEPGTAGGKPVHRVRLGPYANADELTAIQQRLGDGGVTAQAVHTD